jgi:hypothetical protein
MSKDADDAYCLKVLWSFHHGFIDILAADFLKRYVNRITERFCPASIVSFDPDVVREEKLINEKWELEKNTKRTDRMESAPERSESLKEARIVQERRNEMPATGRNESRCGCVGCMVCVSGVKRVFVPPVHGVQISMRTALVGRQPMNTFADRGRMERVGFYVQLCTEGPTTQGTCDVR